MRLKVIPTNYTKKTFVNGTLQVTNVPYKVVLAGKYKFEMLESETLQNLAQITAFMQIQKVNEMDYPNFLLLTTASEDKLKKYVYEKWLAPYHDWQRILKCSTDEEKKSKLQRSLDILHEQVDTLKPQYQQIIKRKYMDTEQEEVSDEQVYTQLLISRAKYYTDKRLALLELGKALIDYQGAKK